MIVSASRRTDIPAFFGEWMYNRLLAKEAIVRNPVNAKILTRIPLSPETTDCIVFWAKDPRNFMEYLDPIARLGHRFYFQFTVTPYGEDIEPGTADKGAILESFIRLSELIGKEKVVWRYDPIIIGEKYDIAYHAKAFGDLCRELGAHTEKCVVSFADEYGFLKERFRKSSIRPPTPEEIAALAPRLKSIADSHGLLLAACCEKTDMSAFGIGRNSCVDGELANRICGTDRTYKKDPGQRRWCGCAAGRDIGTYGTCGHGCVYCYAARTANGGRVCDPESPILCDTIREGEKIVDPKIGGRIP